MGRSASAPNASFPLMPLSKNISVVIGICCFVFTIVFYTTTHLTSLGSFMTERAPLTEANGEYQQYLLWTLQAPSRKGPSQAPQVAHHATQMDQHKSEKQGKVAMPEQEMPSKAAQIAHDATIKLQYAMNSSTISNIRGPNLFSMAKHVSTFARLLEAILADNSIDKRPFLDLRERYFGWWKASTTTYLPWGGKHHSTGIVLTAGQGNMVLAAHAIRTLRRVVNSTLPIQVAYAGDDDLPTLKRQEMRSLDPKLELINILDYFDEGVAGLRSGGYAMKPFAALASRFEKVIIIDADTIFMQRPDEWFEEHEGLKQTGTLFFHDRAYHGRKTTDWVKELFKESGRKPSATLNASIYWQEEFEHQQESGVVYFNKAIPGAFMSLLFTTYMNLEHVRAQLYGHVAGDKETFWLAAELANIPYAFNPSYAGIIGPISANHEGVPEICSPQPLQTDLDGRPFWFNSGLMEDKTDAENRRYANLTYYIPGDRSASPVGGWRFIHDHTFCMGRNLGQMKSIKKAGLEEVVKGLIKEAKAVDEIFNVTTN